MEAGQMLEKHEKEIYENILPRLAATEKAQAAFGKEVATIKTELSNVQKGQMTLEKGQRELEVTVMKDGKETRDLLKPFADHVLKQAEFDSQTEKDITIKKMDTREKIILGLVGGVLGTGGVAGIIVAVATLVSYIN